MKSSEPVYGRPGPVGNGGNGENHTSGLADRSAGVGTGVTAALAAADAEAAWLVVPLDEGVGADVQALATSTMLAKHAISRG